MQEKLAGQFVWLVGAAARNDHLAEVFEEAHMKMRLFEELQPLWEAVEKSPPALMLVDADRFEEKDRLESFCERLDRRRGQWFPVLLMIDDCGEQMRTALYRAGADDFIVKPLVAEEVRARLRGQLARVARRDGGFERPNGGSVASFDAPLSVLVCDDEPMIHRVLRANFERRGWFVGQSNDGAEALEMLDEHDFDLLVFDLSLPFTNGFEILAALEESGSGRHTRKVVMSAEQQPESILRAFELGADDVVTKPLDPEVLVARIERLMRLVRTGESHD